jgi:hypothetical protein
VTPAAYGLDDRGYSVASITAFRIIRRLSQTGWGGYSAPSLFRTTIGAHMHVAALGDIALGSLMVASLGGLALMEIRENRRLRIRRRHKP